MRANPAKSIAALVLGILTAVAATAASSPGSGKKLYKWVDENGVVHYGDRIPPQYAKQERKVLNERGVEVGRLEREKTQAERLADEARLRSVTDARQRDQILLTTYISVRQIEQLRDQRLELIESQVQVTNQYIGTLQERLGKLHARSQFFRPYSSNDNAKPMPDTLAEDLVRTVNEIRVQERNLDGKRTEQDQLRSEFQSDIDRYKELKGLR
jgi:cation transport regulator ChaC